MDIGLLGFFLLIIALFIWLWLRARKRNRFLSGQIDEILSKKQSMSTKYGQMAEQFMPFLSSYPYDRQNFRFLGAPIDGVQFEDDKVVFLEFKASDSKMTPRQRKIKELVESGKVYFEEFRI